MNKITNLPTYVNSVEYEKVVDKINEIIDELNKNV